MSDLSQGHEAVRGLSTAALKAAPAIGVTAWAWLGSNLPTAVALATLIYISIQTAHLIWVWRRERRGKPSSSDRVGE